MSEIEITQDEMKNMMIGLTNQLADLGKENRQLRKDIDPVLRTALKVAEILGSSIDCDVLERNGEEIMREFTQILASSTEAQRVKREEQEKKEGKE